MRRGLTAAVLLVFLLAGARSVGAADAVPEWTDAALRAPGAADKLVAESKKGSSLFAARGLLEKNAPRLPPGEGKRKALAALAELLELAGEHGAAADAWSAAAFSEPGRRDDQSLLESARCLTAVGEADKASAAVRTVLLTGKDPAVLSRARLLAAYLSAFAGESDAPALLSAFLSDGDYAADRPTILFLLARVCGDAAAGKRLAAEFPASPEARVYAAADRIDLAALPLWLLSPGRGAVLVARPVSPVLQIAAPPQAAPPAGPQPAAIPSDQAAASAALAATPQQAAVLLQVGLFRAEPNAAALVARLAAKGFAATAAKRTVNGTEYWSVSVDGGEDPDAAALKLKDAGFESFPLF